MDQLTYQNASPDLTFRDYLAVIFRQKWIIVLTILAITATVKIGLFLQTPKYESQVKMLVSAQKVVEAPYYLQLGGGQTMSAVNTQAEIVKANPVLARTLTVISLKPWDYEREFAHPLKQILIDRKSKTRQENFQKRQISKEQEEAYRYRNSLEDLRNNLSVKPVRDTNMFMISYRDYSPSTAAAIVNIVSRSYVIFDLEQQLAELKIKYGEKNLAVAQLKDSIDQMTRNLSGDPVSDVEAIGPASVKIIEQALQPISRIGYPDTLVLLLSIFAGVSVGMVLAFLFDYFDQKIKSPQEAESLLKIPCVGSIPNNAHANFYRKTADKVAQEMKTRGIKTLLLTAAMPREGVSTVTALLARTICLKPKCRVLVIDGNLKKPSLHKFFKVSNHIGVSDILEGKATFKNAVVRINDYLSILPSGRNYGNPENLLVSPRISEIFRMADEEFDCILIDGANLKETKDFLNWAIYSQAVLMVVDSIKTRKQIVQHELESLNGMRANLLGVVLNKRHLAIPSIIYNRI